MADKIKASKPCHAKEPMKAMLPNIETAGHVIDEVIAGAERVLPTLESFAAGTSNKYDDAVVSFLKDLIAAHKG